MPSKKHQPVNNMVQSMRQIRDEISNEIKDMTFAEERAFLDNILISKELKKQPNKNAPAVQSPRLSV